MRNGVALASNEQEIINHIEEHRQTLVNIAKEIWYYAELGLEEYKSSQLLADTLKKAGFSVKMGVAGLPTAFVATWGSGQPNIGILGEYDALPGLSQKVSGVKEPIEEGGSGHGCGHNIFGVAGVAAAIGVKNLLEKEEKSGTITFFGCPAEETMIGKIHMVKHGLFQHIDACITWHPGALNSLWASSTLAMNSVKFTFKGKASHAATNPESGRSALKAIQLMDTGVHFLREHIIDGARIHSTITDGGLEPNVVPDRAQIWYYVRATFRNDVNTIYKRVLNIAKGAALMTDTEYEVDFITGCYHMLPNKVIGDVLFRSMQKVGPPQFDQADKQLAKELTDSLTPGTKEAVVRASGAPLELVEHNLHETIVDPYDEGKILAGSTDVADVSWNVPTAQFNAASVPIGTPVHSWQFTASVGSGIGEKGMLTAAKILGLTAWELLNNQTVITQAKQEFTAQIAANGSYRSPLEEKQDEGV